MGCSFSSPQINDLALENPAASFYFDRADTRNFGVEATIWDAWNNFGSDNIPTTPAGCAYAAGPSITPIITWTDYSNTLSSSSLTCSNIPLTGSGSLRCDVPVTKLGGEVTINFLDNGDPFTIFDGVGPFIFTVGSGPTPTEGTTTRTSYTALETAYVTNTATVTVTTPPPNCGTPSLRRRQEPKGCNADLVLRALRGNSASASQFCATYTTAMATEGYVYPKFLTSWSTTSTRISSACSCFNGLSPNTAVPTTTSFPTVKGCNADDVLRALRGNFVDARTFCSTYTTAPASAGYAYPSYIAPWSTTSARISSACSCFDGISPTPAPYGASIASFISGSTLKIVSTTSTSTSYAAAQTVATVQGSCPTL